MYAGQEVGHGTSEASEQVAVHVVGVRRRGRLCIPIGDQVNILMDEKLIIHKACLINAGLNWRRGICPGRRRRHSGISTTRHSVIDSKVFVEKELKTIKQR